MKKFLSFTLFVSIITLALIISNAAEAQDMTKISSTLPCHRKCSRYFRGQIIRLHHHSRHAMFRHRGIRTRKYGWSMNRRTTGLPQTSC